MGNLGGGEILAILLVGLLVLGPERLPGAVRQAGKALRQVRKVTVGFQEELRSAVEDPIVEAKARLSGEALLREVESSGDAAKPGGATTGTGTDGD
jgi:sec-independent protein translocase protein TatB